MTSGPPGSDNGTLKLKRGFQQWVRTWLVYPGEFLDTWMYFIWDSHPHVNEGITLISDRAFQSEEQKESLAQRVSEWRENRVSIKERDQYFAELAQPFIAQNPTKYHVVLPLLRAMNQWLEMPFVWHFQKEYVFRFSPRVVRSDLDSVGLKRTAQRVAKTIGSILALGVHYTYFVILLAIICLTTRLRNPYVIAIVGGTILFTSLSAYSGMAELRRNLPFFPAHVFLLFYCSERYLQLFLNLAKRPWAKNAMTHPPS